MTHPVPATTCPECEGRLRAEDDETVCGACGLVVVEDRLDRGPEWRSFEAVTRSAPARR